MALSDDVFQKLDLLSNQISTKDYDGAILMVDVLETDLDKIAALLNSEFSNEKKTFLLLHDLTREQYSYAKLLITIVIIISVFLIFSMLFWIYKTFRLSEQDTQKTEFVSMITHELKTPLAPILNACEMLTSELLGKINSSQKEEIERIQRNTTSLLQIIVDILDAQKLDMGKLVFTNSKFSIATLFDELKSDYDELVSEKNIKFSFDMKDDISLDSDKNRIRQVFDNLIKNSIDFVKPNVGMIQIGSYREDNHVIFFVKDNGVGIPKSEQSNLFKSFYPG